MKHKCPICRGVGCIPQDDRNGKCHCTQPCPPDIGCNGSREVSDFKYKWILENTKNGKIFHDKCQGYHKVHLTEEKQDETD